MKRREPITGRIRSRAAIVCTASSVELIFDALITDAPQPAAATVVRAPGQDRRLDPPGLRQRLPDEHAPRASNPRVGRQVARASVPGAVALPGCAPPPSQPHG